MKKSGLGFFQHLVQRLSWRRQDIIAPKVQDSALGAGFSTLELLIILVVAILLSVFVASKYTGVLQVRHDDTRKNDITNLQLAVQSYWAQTGNFPSLAQLNSPTFRQKDLNKLDASVLRDPHWSAKNKACTASGQPILQDSSQPNAGCYGYIPLPAGCDNQKSACASYLLNARLEAGGFYAKSSG